MFADILMEDGLGFDIQTVPTSHSMNLKEGL